MNKQFYGIAALALVFATTACANELSGKTAMRGRAAFEAADQVRVSLSQTELYRQHLNDNNGFLQIAVFGGMNTQRDNAAQYYMPDAHDTYTVQAAYTGLQTLNNAGFNVVGLTTAQIIDGADGAAVAAINGTAVGATDAVRPYGAWFSTVPGDDPTTSWADGNSGAAHFGSFFADPNYDTSILRAWNFGIDMEGFSAGGTFESTIKPTLKQSQAGVGLEWNQHLSDDAVGFFMTVSTAVQWLQNHWEWNETPVTPQATLAAAWSDGGFPSGDDRPEDFTQAFAQAAWNYGKVNGKQHVTRLSDIEVRFGYEFACEDTHHVQGYLGAIFPTGNKMKGVYLAEPVVGNGGHFGIMFGGTTEVQFTSDSDWKASARWDYNWRFLFQNKQVRSFDLRDSQLSRYMYVWPDFATFEAAQGDATAYYAFTPGINVFTKEVKVSPRQQFRVNTALVFGSEHFQGELGLNMMARQAEKVELSTAWTDTVALVGTLNGYNTPNVALAINRSIYNDSINNQLATAQGGIITIADDATNGSWTSDQQVPATGAPQGGAAAAATMTFDAGNGQALTEDDYNAVVITADRLDLGSAASPTALTGAPYLALGYAWEGDSVPGFIGIGGSYEYSFENRFINSWQLWGKLGFSF